MRETMSDACKVIVSEITGLSDELLRVVAGAVDITIYVGRTPGASELSFFLGLSRKEMEKKFNVALTFIRQSFNFRFWSELSPEICDDMQSVIYALSTHVLSSIFYGDEVINLELAQSKRLMRNLFDSATITNARLFHGYNIALEYLWFYARGGVMEPATYVRLRYGRRSDTAVCLTELSGLAHVKRNYKQFLRWLAEKYDELVENEGE